MSRENHFTNKKFVQYNSEMLTFHLNCPDGEGIDRKYWNQLLADVVMGCLSGEETGRVVVMKVLNRRPWWHRLPSSSIVTLNSTHVALLSLLSSSLSSSFFFSCCLYGFHCVPWFSQSLSFFSQFRGAHVILACNWFSHFLVYLRMHDMIRPHTQMFQDSCMQLMFAVLVAVCICPTFQSWLFDNILVSPSWWLLLPFVRVWFDLDTYIFLL